MARTELPGDRYALRTLSGFVFAASLLPVAAFAGDAQDPVPKDAPAYFRGTYRSAIQAPLPNLSGTAAGHATPFTLLDVPTAPEQIYNQGGLPSSVGPSETDADAPLGSLGTYQPGGATDTSSNAFFTPLGQNGRACVTCHEPPSGMSVSLANIQARAKKTKGTDPIFAPVDGADCPNLAGAGSVFSTAHSLLLTRGLIRIFLPVPTQTPEGNPTEYTVNVLSDPNGCNTNPTYAFVPDANGNPTTQRLISVYRRPVISTNLKFKTTTLADLIPGFNTDPVYGTPLATDPNTGQLESGNIMWDGREPTLQSQAIDATLGHSQAAHQPTAAQISQIVQFETGIFSAQSADKLSSGSLDLLSKNALGGPIVLSGQTPVGTFGAPTFNIFSAWQTVTGLTLADLQRESIFRGQQIFNTKPFNVTKVAGFNDALGGLSGTGTVCATCHGQQNSGADPLPDGQRDLGIGGTAASEGGPAPSPVLPIFQVNCINGATTHFTDNNGNPVTSITTNDLGLALITGRCADVGRFTTPSLRGLASHAPYFTDGSAPTLTDVVNFYNARFNIGLQPNDVVDLVNFLASL